MTENRSPSLSKAPFLIADALLLGVAGWLIANGPLDTWRVIALIAAVAVAAWLGVMPFIIEFRARMQLANGNQLADVTSQLGDLQALARQISSSGAEWQQIHQSTTQTITAADQIAEKMVLEARNFGEVLTRMNEAEKNHLRLEVDKLRRSEGEWLQVIIRMLDHVYALHQAGVRSGQRNIIDQLASFQGACRDTVRRLGLVPLLTEIGTPYDAKQHQLLEGQAAADGNKVCEVLAPGYTYQGQLLRLPLVALKKAEPAKKAIEPDAQLSFDDQPSAAPAEKQGSVEA